MTWRESLKTSTFILRPLFQPHDAPSPLPRGRSHVIEQDLNSPWEGPRSGSYCTPTPFGVLYMQHFQLGSLGRLNMQYTLLGYLPLRDKGIPHDRQLYFCLSRRKAAGRGIRTHHPPDWVSANVQHVHFDLSQKAEKRCISLVHANVLRTVLQRQIPVL